MHDWAQASFEWKKDPLAPSQPLEDNVQHEHATSPVDSRLSEELEERSHTSAAECAANGKTGKLARRAGATVRFSVSRAWRLALRCRGREYEDLDTRRGMHRTPSPGGGTKNARHNNTTIKVARSINAHEEKCTTSLVIALILQP